MPSAEEFDRAVREYCMAAQCVHAAVLMRMQKGRLTEKEREDPRIRAAEERWKRLQELRTK